MPIGQYIDPGQFTDAYTFQVPAWATFDEMVAVIDDPVFAPAGSAGTAHECNELDNEAILDLAPYCP